MIDRATHRDRRHWPGLMDVSRCPTKVVFLAFSLGGSSNLAAAPRALLLLAFLRRRRRRLHQRSPIQHLQRTNALREGHRRARPSGACPCPRRHIPRCARSAWRLDVRFVPLRMRCEQHPPLTPYWPPKSTGRPTARHPPIHTRLASKPCTRSPASPLRQHWAVPCAAVMLDWV